MLFSLSSLLFEYCTVSVMPRKIRKLTKKSILMIHALWAWKRTHPTTLERNHTVFCLQCIGDISEGILLIDSHVFIVSVVLGNCLWTRRILILKITAITSIYRIHQ